LVPSSPAEETKPAAADVANSEEHGTLRLGELLQMLKHHAGWFTWFFVVAAISALSAAGSGYLAPAAGPALQALETDVEVGGCADGERREVLLPLQNNLGRSMRVLGHGTC
jgi:hypothetical protein